MKKNLCIEKIVVFSFCLLTFTASLPAFAMIKADPLKENSPEQIDASKIHTLHGKVQLWARPVCSAGNSNHDCQLPKRIEPAKQVRTELVLPAKPGTVTRQREIVRFENFIVWLTFYWTYPRKGEPYIVTQTLLYDKEMNPIAECNRYDLYQNLQPFPVGVCSGFLFGQQYGASLIRISQ